MSASGAYGDGQAVVDETFEWDHRPISSRGAGRSATDRGSPTCSLLAIADLTHGRLLTSSAAAYFAIAQRLDCVRLKEREPLRSADSSDQRESERLCHRTGCPVGATRGE